MNTDSADTAIFLRNIIPNNVNTVFELGARDLLDALTLQKYYDADVYSFECNPDCISVCRHTRDILGSTKEASLSRITLVDKAVSETDGKVSFYPFDLNKYNNMGASSLFKIDFSRRRKGDPDYNKPNPQKHILVDGIRLDTYLAENDHIPGIDLICMDLQGYELNALKSLGNHLHRVKYIITECSIESNYDGGANFSELQEFLLDYGFSYKCSNKFKYSMPEPIKYCPEFDSLFVNERAVQSIPLSVGRRLIQK